MNIDQVRAKLDRVTAGMRDDPVKFEVSGLELFMLAKAAQVGVAAIAANSPSAPPEQREHRQSSLEAFMHEIDTEMQSRACFAATVAVMLETRIQPMLDGGEA